MLALLASLEITCSDFAKFKSNLFKNSSLTQTQKKEVLKTFKDYLKSPQ